MTALSRKVYYFLDDLYAVPRGVATVRNAGPIRPAHSILLSSPPSLLGPKPLSTHPLDPRLLDRWQTTKIFEISVAARKERYESLTVNVSLLVDSEEPEKPKHILV